jgi:DNA repair protein RecO (recombination protein O)
MSLYRTKVIVLRSRNLGEADRVLVLFSGETGKFEAVVKGARRQRSRFVGNTLPFNYLEGLFFTGKNLDSLSQAELIHSFSALRDDLNKFAYATFWVELVDGFVPERQEAGDIFRFLLAAFIVLENTAEPEIINLAFQVRLLKYLGYQPELNRCVSCGEFPENKRLFSAEAGGLVCMNCASQFRDLLPVSLELLNWFEQLGETDLREVHLLKIQMGNRPKLFALLSSFIENRLERPLKSRVFLDNLNR